MPSFRLLLYGGAVKADQEYWPPGRVRDHDNAERNDGDGQGFCFNPLDDDYLRSAPSEDNIAEKAGQNPQGIS